MARLACPISLDDGLVLDYANALFADPKDLLMTMSNNDVTWAEFIDVVCIVLLVAGLVFIACVGAKTYTDSHMEDD